YWFLCHASMFLEANDYKSPFPITENRWVNMQESSLYYPWITLRGGSACKNLQGIPLLSPPKGWVNMQDSSLYNPWITLSGGSAFKNLQGIPLLRPPKGRVNIQESSLYNPWITLRGGSACRNGGSP
ncbi:MAG: hypothetical protein KBH09_16360, partial [Saprospiraceae bacterium]|nr:hypothetical protein [Saprospiraceae bacterium]